MAQELEINIRYRLVTEDGCPGALRWRYFRNAREARDFLIKLDSPDSRQAISISIQRRSIGPWEYMERLDLDHLATGEGAAS